MTGRNIGDAVVGALAVGLAASAASAEGNYFGGFGGLASVNDIDIDIGDILALDEGFVIGGVIGREISATLRIEGELSYHRSSGDCVGGGKCAIIDFDLKTLAVLGNVWVDFDAGAGLRP